MPIRFRDLAARFRVSFLCRLVGLPLVALLAAAGMGWSPAAQAIILTPGCAIQAVTPPPISQSGIPGSTFTYSFQVVNVAGGCSVAATGTIALQAGDTTGGASAPSVVSWSGLPGTVITFNGTTGPNAGTAQWAAQCNAGACTGSGSSRLVFTGNAVNAYTFTPTLPSASGEGVILPGGNINLQGRALRNGTTPVVGATVTWSVVPTPPGPTTLTPATSTTSAGGLASTNFSANTVGNYSIEGYYCNPDSLVACIPIQASYTIFVGTTVVALAGDLQAGNANTALPIPLRVQVSNGSGASAVGVPMTWSVRSGSATITATSGPTDIKGEATADITLGNAPGTSVIVRAARTDFPTIFEEFFLTINDDYTLSVVGSNSLTAVIGQSVPLTTRYLLNGGANPNAVNWSLPAVPAGGTLTVLSSLPNAVTGDATTSFSSTAAGTFVVTASGSCPARGAPNCPPTPVDITIQVIDKTLTTAVTNVQGYPTQSFLLTARALDNAVPASGVNVNWTVAGPGTPASGTVATNASGDSQFTVTLGNTIGGTVTVVATRADNPAATVTITLGIVQPNLTPISGSGQSGFIGAAALAPLVVELRDGKTGNAVVPGATVNWSVVSGPAVLGSPTSVTNGAGRASNTFNFGAASGVSTIRAIDALTGLAIADFTATTINGTLSKITPDTQGYPGQVIPLTARVLNDGSPVSGVNVNWVVSGPGSPANGTVASNAAAGDATFSVTLGNSVGLNVTVTATRQDNPAATQTWTLGIVQPNLTIISGNGQDGYPEEVSQQLVVELRSGLAGNAPVPGAGINWSVLSGPATIAPSSNTDGSGRAAITFNFGVSMGPSVIRATDALTGLAIANFNAFTVAPILIKVSGDGQSADTGTAFADPLVVQALDDGVGAPGRTINWSVLSGDATLTDLVQPTDGNGEAAVTVMAGTSAGTITIEASRSDVATGTQVFTLTSVTPDPTLDLALESGDGQSGLPGTPAPDPLLVYATNGGSSAPGVTINWVVTSGSATLASGSSVTNSDGIGSMDVTFGSTPGPVVITATRADEPLAAVPFNLVVSGPTLLIHDGDGQRAPVGTALPLNLVVEAANDAAPADGVNISWTLVSGDAVLGSCCATTAGGGFAGIPVTFGSTPGPIQIRAERTDAPGVFVDFNLESFVARELLVESGDDQSGAANTALPLPLVVRARDNGSDSAGIDINWAVTAGTAVLSAPSSTTGAGGLASVSLTLGATGGPVTITATRADDSAFVATFTATVVVDETLLVVSGNGQDGLIGSQADLPLKVRLTGSGGTPVAEAPITWQVLSGPGTLSALASATNGLGEAEVNLTFGNTAGTVTIQASANDGSLTAIFTAYASMADIAGVDGNNQSGPVNTTLPLPFKVRVNLPDDARGPNGQGASTQALSGVPVVWAVVNGGGTLSVSNGTTNAAGESSTTLTLGAAAGANTVTATVPGGPSVTFNATAFIPSGNLVVVSGNNQTLPTNTDTQPLRVKLTTAGNAPMAGVTIDWSGSNAAVSSDTCVTNAQGECSITAKVSLPGAASIEASSTSPESGPVVFTLNGGVAKLPNLSQEQEVIADVIDTFCPVLAGLVSGDDDGEGSPTGSLDAGQSDLLGRCIDIVNAAGLDPEAAIEALDELFPDFALVQASAALQAAQAQFDNLKARIAALRAGTRGASFGGLALNTSGGMVPVMGFASMLGEDDPAGASSEAGADFGRWGFFASGTIGRGESERGSVTPSYDYDINGLTVGVDYRQSDKWILGAAAGFTRQDTELLSANGNLDTSGWSLSAYTTYYQENSWYVDGVLTYGSNSYDAIRDIRYTLPLPGGGTRTVDQQGRTSSDGGVLSGAITFGRDFQKGGWGFGPYGRLLYTRLTFDNSIERLQDGTGTGLGLEIETRDLTSLVTTLGGKLTYTHSTDWGVLMPHFQLEWERELKDDPASIEARFLNDPTNTPIIISADPLDQSYFRLGLGMSMVLTNSRSGFILYERMIGRDGQSQDNLALGFRMEF